MNFAELCLAQGRQCLSEPRVGRIFCQDLFQTLAGGRLAALDEIDLHPFQEGSMAHSSRPTANPKCLCEALAGGVMKTLVCECSTT
ncbi:hypothetical protein WN67_20470 [Mycolicibacterium obuense]|uniref:Uncharacterized protein n=1 Tax=Mycolicibacterium obuense TaxID=1807 RepID=A0A0M2JYV2_9MYCO|nr:hypothetical protein WN67_20470 [Mycolicibacterium obuense]